MGHLTKDLQRLLQDEHPEDSSVLWLQKYMDPDTRGGNQNENLGKWCQSVKSNFDKIQVLLSSEEGPVSMVKPEGAICFCGTSKAPLMVNHSGGLIDNTNLCLHPRFGYPMIPGSALKGIARAAAFADSKNDADKMKRFSRVFGGEEKGKSDVAGSVAFLAAVPSQNNWSVKMDVLTSHHHATQSGNPVPVYFPVVSEKISFLFTIAPTTRTQDGDLVYAKKMLMQALQENGIGSKTAAGYGWFEFEETKPKLGLDAFLKRWDYYLVPANGGPGNMLAEIGNYNDEAQKEYCTRMLNERNTKKKVNKWKDANGEEWKTFSTLLQKFNIPNPQ